MSKRKGKREARIASVPAVISLSEIEHRALHFARREFLFWRQNNSNPWSASSSFSPTASQAMVQSFLIRGWGDVMTRQWLVMLARRGLRDAQAALQRIILEYQSGGERMPTELAAYDMDVKRFGLPAQWAGPKSSTRMLRDMIIMMTTMAVVDKFELPRTTSSPNRRSACEIVSMALEAVGIFIGYKGVQKIVERYRGAWPTVPGWTAHFWPT